MKSLHLFCLVFILGLCIGCDPADLCEDTQCGPGVCIDGSCECPCGFSGVNCEIEDGCNGVVCCNGECDPQTDTCRCDPNYYGQSCDILCVNGEFVNGSCNCLPGYEGLGCQIESRNGFLGWWSCQEWTLTSGSSDTTYTGPLLGSIKFECGDSIPEVEFFPTDNSTGLMLLSSDNRVVGEVTRKTIDFGIQYFTGVSVQGASRLGSDRILTVELDVVNTTTLVRETAIGKFTLFRNIEDCD